MSRLIAGLHVVLEGPDGCGKSTVIEELYKYYQGTLGSDVILTRHPGCTPLGKHIRTILKDPKSIDSEITYSNVIRQVLHMVDAMSYNDLVLTPALHDNVMVLADRSTHISSLVYGLLDGLRLDTIDKLYGIFDPPKIDRLYVLCCPYSIRRTRMTSRRADYFDSKPPEFMIKLDELYNNLLTNTDVAMAMHRLIHFENVIYINAEDSASTVFENIRNDLDAVIADRLA